MIHDAVNIALATFAEITKLDSGNWCDSQTIEDLNEAYRMDQSGLTVFMMIQGLTDSFLAGSKFSAKEIMADPERFAVKMRELKTLKDVLDSEEVTSLAGEFQASVVATAKKYNAPKSTITAIKELFNDPNELALLRRDALKSLEQLEHHQFLQGTPETTHLSLNRHVWEFWNINSLVLALRDQQEPGLTLTLIKDPSNALHSFFVFAIKNGENVTILTDRTNYAHPMQKHMTRRPDKEFSRRAQLNWFPYYLIELGKVVEKDIFGEDVVTGLYEKQIQSNALVPYNTAGVRMCEIKDLLPPYLVWLMLMAEKIDEQYGKKNHKLPMLSYTGEMVVRPRALASGEGSLVLSGQYRPLETITISTHDVTRDTTAGQWEREQTGFNNWIEDRYAAQVPAAILNVVGDNNVLQLEDGVGLSSIDQFGSRSNTKLVTFDPVSFGTETMIRRDIMWMARHNQSEMIDKLAKEEFDKEKDSVNDFWKSKIADNREALVRGAASLDFKTTVRRYKTDDSGDPNWFDGGGKISTWGHIPVDLEVNLASRFCVQPNWGTYETVWFDAGVEKEDTSRGRTREVWKQRCAVNGKPPSLFLCYEPRTPQALADMMDIPVESMPLFLQNWHREKPYVGNSILDRIDPLDWNVRNPWLALKFQVVVCFSRSGLNKIRKEIGIPRFEGIGHCKKCYDEGGEGGDYRRYGKCPRCHREAKVEN